MDYQFPMEGVPASKFVATRTGLGKYNTVTKVANDFDCRLCIEEKGPIVRWQLCSKVQPFDFCFKFDKEVEIFDPHLKENTKNIVTKDGNCVTVVTKSSHGTWITKC